MDKSDKIPETSAPDLHSRQVDAIENVVKLLSPEQVESRLRKLITKSIALVALSAAVLTGGWELTVWAIDSWNQRAVINTWIEVAREVYEAEGNGEVAITFLEKVEEIDPQNVKLVQLRAYIDGMSAMKVLLNLDRPWNMEELNQADMAKAQAILLQEVNPSSPDGLILRGQVTAALDENERAKAFLEQALVLDSDNSFARVRLAFIYRNLANEAYERGDESGYNDEYKKSKALLDKAFALDPNSKLACLWIGIYESVFNEDAEAAHNWFDKALEIDSRYYLAKFNKGLVYLDDYDYDSAISSFNETLKIKPNFVLALENLAYSYGLQDQYETGIQYARRANSLDEGFMAGWAMTGQLALELYKQTEEAEYAKECIDAYSTALRYAPTNSDWYQLRSDIQLLLGNLTEAGKDARLAVRFAPEDYYAWLVLGNYQSELGMFSAAEESYRTSLKLKDEDNEDASKGLAIALMELGNLDGAEAQFEILIENSGDDLRSSNLVARAEFYVKSKQFKFALDDYTNARVDDDENFDAWLGEARMAQVLQTNRAQFNNAIIRCRELKPEITLPLTEADYD
jgi:tetratricopeptide (TPR) repeat protein